MYSSDQAQLQAHSSTCQLDSLGIASLCTQTAGLVHLISSPVNFPDPLPEYASNALLSSHFCGAAWGRGLLPTLLTLLSAFQACALGRVHQMRAFWTST